MSTGQLTIPAIPAADAQKLDRWSVLNIYLLLCTSGIIFFSKYMMFLLLAVNIGVFIYKKKKMDSYFFSFLFFFIVLGAFQILWFADGDIVTYVGFLLRIVTAYLVLKNSKDFIFEFLSIMGFLSISGVLIFAFFTIVPSLENMLFARFDPWDDSGSIGLNKSLIIYNIHKEPLFGTDALGLFGLARNSGAFWEPGGFAGYLILAIALELLITRKMSWRVLSAVIALFTTFSTTAYIGAAIFFFLYIIFVDTDNKARSVILPVFAISIWFMIFNVEFLADKITDQMQSFKEGELYASQTENDTRIGTASLDMKDLARSPWFGTGPSVQTRYGPNESLFFRTNGVTDFLVRVGIIGFLTCMGMLYVSFKRFFTNMNLDKAPLSAFLLTFTIILISASETYFNTPFIWTLFFFGFVKEMNQPPDTSNETV